MANNQQIPFINNLRGLASLSVCLYHFIYSTVNYVNDPQVLDIAFYGQYGVTLFFVISGIVIPLSLLRANYSILKWHKFFLKRVTRIEPPYIAAMALAILIILARGYFLKDKEINVSVKQVALHIGYLIPFFPQFKWLNEVFATLAIEFQYYLAISILILLVIKGKLIGRFIFYGIMFALPFFFHDNYLFPPYSAMFLTGMCWSFYYVKKIKMPEFIIVLLISSAIVYYKFAHLDGVYCFCIVAAVHFLNKFSVKFLDFFGTISYSLYLVHPLIGATIINVLSHKYVLSWQKPIVISLGLVASIISACIMYRFVEKPTQLLSKRITY